MSRTRLLLASLTLLVAPLTACLESTITLACEDIATAQCEQCYACALDAPGLAGYDLCGFERELEQAECVTALTERCESQSSGQQQPNDALEACLEALEAGDQLTCDLLHEAAAQDRERTIEACGLFL